MAVSFFCPIPISYTPVFLLFAEGSASSPYMCPEMNPLPKKAFSDSTSTPRPGSEHFIHFPLKSFFMGAIISEIYTLVSLFLLPENRESKLVSWEKETVSSHSGSQQQKVKMESLIALSRLLAEDWELPGKMELA